MENRKNKSHATKHRRLGMSCVFGFLLLICLAGCAENQTGTDISGVSGEQPNGKYVCTGYYDILSRDEETSGIWAGCGNFLYSVRNAYYYKGEEIEGSEIETLVEDYDDFEVKTDILRWLIDETGISSKEQLCTLDGCAMNIAGDQEGKPYLIIASSAAYLGLRDELFLVGLDHEGKVDFHKELEQGCQPKELSLNANGKLMLLDRNRLLLFNKKGEMVAAKKIDSVGQIVSACGTTDDEFFFVGMEKWLITKRIKVKTEEISDDEHGMTELRYAPGVGVLGRNTEKIYRYSKKDKTWQELLDIVDLDVNPREMIAWWMGAEDSIYIVTSDSVTDDYCLAVALRKREDEIEKKEVIKLGVNGNADKLQRMAVRFNRSNEKYRVEIVDYMDGINPYSDSKDMELVFERMKMDFLSGEGPDLICTDLVRIADIPMKELVEDLTPYLNQSDTISRSDFFEEVLQANNCNGALSYLTDSFTISTLLCKASLREENQGQWTMEDMLSLSEEYPEALLFQRPVGSRELVREYSSKQMIENFLMLNQERVFSGEKPDATLLIAVLSKAKEEYELKQEVLNDTYDALIKKEILLVNANFVDFYDVMRYYLGSFGRQDMKAIGYPSESGQGKSIIVPGMGIGILSTSKHKNAAWVFLEYYISNSDGEDLRYFSSRKSVYDRQMKKAYQFAEEKRNPGEKRDMEEDDYMEVSALRCLQDAIDDAIGSDQVIDEVILNIVFDEVPSLYNGDKSAETVADIIGNRVRLYLREK